MFISKKKLNQLINDAKNEGYESGYSKGNEKGYSAGLHKGLTADKKGVYYTSKRMYVFEDGIEEEIKFKTGYIDTISRESLGTDVGIFSGTLEAKPPCIER